MDRDRFVRLWERCTTDSPGTPVFDDLEQSYSEAHRRYHTGEHIGHCLKQLDLARGEMRDADAIEMALWFHDVEYDPQAADNELRSAERFKNLASGVMVQDLEEQIYRLIMVTMHDDSPAATDEQYMVDIDLSSFGLPWDEFLEDSTRVQEEFAHLPEGEFAKRNHRFLGSLLKRSNIFSTRFYRDRFEETARDNIAKRMKLLEQQFTESNQQ